jgi:hypothetical protein
VSPADDLAAVVAGAEAGAVIALEDGTHTVPSGGLRFDAPGVTLRSVSGDPEAVVVDGAWAADEVVRVYADDVTLADLTLTRAVHHLVHVQPTDGTHVERPLFHRVRFVDAGQQLLKANSGGGSFTEWTNDGVVECSAFVMTADGRDHVSDCYTGGIDVHGGRDWVVTHSFFTGIWCEGGVTEHAVHFWSRSRDTLVENNLIVDNARGIGLGLGSDPTGGGRTYDDAEASWGQLQHIGGLVRNNVIWNAIPRYDTGIEIQRAATPKVLHNTVLSRESAATGRFSSIDHRFGSTEAVIRNNLVWRITERDGSTATLEGNVEGADGTWLVDPDGGDFHLAAGASEAIDSAVADPDSGRDIDGEPHPETAPDVGADER